MFRVSWFRIPWFGVRRCSVYIIGVLEAAIAFEYLFSAKKI